MTMLKQTTMLLLLLFAINLGSCLTADEANLFQARAFIERHTQAQGSVTATLLIEENMVIIRSNGIPDHDTGVRTRYLNGQSHEFQIPFLPTLTEETFCLPDGVIGVARNGVPIYNPFTENCCDSGTVEKSTQDVCWGRVNDGSSEYHYTTPPLCVQNIVCNQSDFIGVALDGLPIYGPYDENGKLLTAADLDECHGRFDRREYKYHVTNDFPYMIGCFKGVPLPTSGVSGTCHCKRIGNCFPNGQTDTPTPPPPITPSLSTSAVQQPNGNDEGYRCCDDPTNCIPIYNQNGAVRVSTRNNILLMLLLQLIIAFLVFQQ